MTEKYRIIQNGYRRFDSGCARGMIVPRGWSVERLEQIDGKPVWIFVDTVHPDDAQPFIDNLIKKENHS